jgi:hypothetical protein
MNNLALTESKTLRNDKLQSLSNDQALDAINKAKSLVMAAWKGENLATVAQLAEFYEVPEETINKVYQRHKDELDEDGVRLLRGKALSDYQSVCNGHLVQLKARSLKVFTPKSALRLGMLLRDSEVAKSVRDVILYLAVDIVPQQSIEIEKLRLENENLKLQNENLKLRKDYLERRDAIRELHGVQMLALLDGRPDAVVEKIEKITETIVVKDGRHVSFEGQSTAQLGKSLGFKTGKDFERWLEKIGKVDLICQGFRACPAPYIPTENIKEVKKLWSDNSTKNRQLIIGE